MKAGVCGKRFALTQPGEPLPVHLVKLLRSATPRMGRFDKTVPQEMQAILRAERTKETDAAHVGTNGIKQITAPKGETKIPV